MKVKAWPQEGRKRFLTLYGSRTGATKPNAGQGTKTEK